MKRLLAGFCLAMFMSGVVSADTIRLSRHDFYPRQEDDYYFRAFPDIGIVDDLLFGVENFGHKVLMFSIRDGIELIKEIGREGQGPGEFRLPISISVWNDEIAIKDEHGFSFLDTDGNFKSRFVLPSYGSGSLFLYAHGKIYAVNQRIDDAHLLDIYTLDGKMLSNVGSKYLEIDTSRYQGFGPYGIGRAVYEGDLSSENDIICYVNYKFGDVRKMNLSGELLLAKNICDHFGEHGKETFRFNKDTFIDNGVKLAETNRFVPASKVISDACLLSGVLYLLESDFTPGVKRRKTEIRIVALDVETFELEAQYVFAKREEDRVFSFAVSEFQGKPIFYVHMETEDYIIAEYRIEE